VRILFVIPQISNFTGDAGLMLWLGETLKKKGHEILIVTSDADPFVNDVVSSKKYAERRDLLTKNTEKVIQIDEHQVLPIHSTSYKLGMYCPNAKKIAEKLIPDYDLIHIFSWYYHLGIIFSQVAKKYNVPYAFTPFATLLPDAQKFFKRKKQIINLLYTKKMVTNASALHAVGNSEVPIFVKMGVDPKKIHTIENGIDLKEFEITPNSNILKKIDLDKDEKFLLFFGRIHPKKGIEFLLKAFQKFHISHDDISLIIGGHGEQEYVEEIKLLVKKLGIESAVRFTGYATHEEKLELFTKAEVFLLTSLADVHPKAILESLSVGTPVIISKECDFPEVEEFEAGIIVGLDINEIHNALITMFENEENRNKYSENARRLVNERFLLDNQIKKMIQMYENLIKK
jgi:glycosyltransferase involved in cell wall biosynthesis|tara:strand:+ start:1878 stop:3080 length:1203 start_codon:yes stop_codon:yes gene_type:complete